MDTLPPIATTDHDRLIRVETMMETVYRGLMGNGQEGLIRGHEALKTEVVEVRSDLERFVTEKMAEAKAAGPGKGGQRFAQVTAAVAFIVAVIQGVVTAMKS